MLGVKKKKKKKKKRKNTIHCNATIENELFQTVRPLILP